MKQTPIKEGNESLRSISQFDIEEDFSQLEQRSEQNGCGIEFSSIGKHKMKFQTNKKTLNDSDLSIDFDKIVERTVHNRKT